MVEPNTTPTPEKGGGNQIKKRREEVRESGKEKPGKKAKPGLKTKK